MGRKLHLFPTASSPNGGRAVPLQNAWLYWKQDGHRLLLRIDANGNVVRHVSGALDDPKSYTEPFTVEEGATVEAAHSLDPKPLPDADVDPQFEKFTLKQSLSQTLSKVGRVSAVNGKKTDVPALPKAPLPMREARPAGSKDVMLVPDVPLKDQPGSSDLNAHARKFGEQWKLKDKAHRELVLIKPGTSPALFSDAMAEAAVIAVRGTVILNVGHGSDESVTRGTAFFDMTPRRNNKKGQSAEATGAMFTDDRNDTGDRDPRVLAFEKAGAAFEKSQVRLFVVLSCRVGASGADLFMKDTAFTLRTDVQGYKQKILFQLVTDKTGKFKSATALEIEGSVSDGLDPGANALTEIPRKFVNIVKRPAERPDPSAE